jgi:competence protein ComEC
MIRRPAPFVLGAFGAGLLTGLSRFGDTRVVVLLLALAILPGWRWRPQWSLWLTLGLLGRLMAVTALADAAQDCAALIPAGKLEITVRLEELPDPRGGMVEVQPVSECQQVVLARWPGGDTTSVPGSEGQVRGRWLPDTVVLGRPSGLLLVESFRRTGGVPTLAERLRTVVSRQIRSLYGARGGVVEALLLNRRASMSPELRQRYARSGLVHLLSISGFHVGLIAAWIVLLGRPLVVRYGPPGAVTTIPLLAAGVATAYVLFLGWPPPAARAALLVVIMAAERVRQRRVDADSLLAVIALVLLALDPWCITSLGAWLSFLSLWGASRLVQWCDRAWSSHSLARVTAGSVGALVATAPLTASVLGMVSLAGIALNLVAIPLAAIALPGVLASVTIAPIFPALGAALAAGSGLGLAALDGLATLGASVPGLAIQQPAEPRSAVPWIALLAATLWATAPGMPPVVSRLRWLAVVTGASWLLVFGDLVSRVGARDQGLTLHFLDVGQGDAALVHSPAGQWVVIDAGPRGPAGDAGRDVVAPALERLGASSVATMVLSHPHLDHIGGAEAVLHAMPVGLVLEPGDEVADSVYLGLLDAVGAAGSKWRGAREGDTLLVDSLRFVIVHPAPDWPDRGLDLNEDSAVLRLEYGGCRILFAGDAGFDAESAMQAETGPVDLLKVGHHGSRGSSGDPWLETLDARAAVISVGARNRYGHPAPETLRRLADHGVPVWRTDQDGEVTVRVRDHALEVSSRRATALIPCHSTDP